VVLFKQIHISGEVLNLWKICGNNVYRLNLLNHMLYCDKTSDSALSHKNHFYTGVIVVIPTQYCY
jgi:hypothetical protein